MHSLFDTLQSIEEQKLADGLEMYLSWSIDAALQPRVVDSVRARFARLLAPRFQVLHSEVRLSQFEHFKVCHEALRARLGATADQADVWVIFGDDDDLWHPLRAHSVVKLFERSRAEHSISALVFAETSRATLAGGQARARSPAEVDALLASGKCWKDKTVGDWSVNDSMGDDARPALDAGPKAADWSKGGGFEYWQLVVRLRTLSAFFADETAAALLKYHFCDVAFSRYVRFYRTEESKTVVAPQAASNWWYHHSHTPPEQRTAGEKNWNSSIRTPTREDVAVVEGISWDQRLRPAVVAALPSLVAHVRELLELGFVKHAFDGERRGTAATMADWLKFLFAEGGHVYGFVLGLRQEVGALVFTELATKCADYFAGTLDRMQIPGFVAKSSASYIRQLWCLLTSSVAR
ncbi:hypothetical protein T492DRAFT_1101723 [Pavlovales sp. CCMP2436]|nr:hypothetical protein T492DRAFT_1101723 [Pavlovales sp. CCMP2436]